MFYSTDNPFKGKVEDATVQKYWNMFGTKSSTKAAAAGFPDFFVYKICEGYLFDKDMEIQFVEGNGNCLQTLILKTLDFEKDPGSDQMYTQMYLRQAVMMHLISMWEIIGADISENIKYLYGHPDSEVGGIKIKKATGKGKNRIQTYRFSVKDCCLYILRDGSWCDEIFIKLVSSMWGCRVSILHADNLSAVTCQYKGSYNEAEITLMYNGNPTTGNYSPIRQTWRNLQFDANEIEPLTFSPNYKKEIDLDERLNRRDSIWNFDDDKMEKRIFSKKRGYMFAQEGKGKDKDRKEDQKVIGEALMIGKDELIVKKIDYEALQERICELEKRGTEVGEDEVIMKMKEVEAMKNTITEFEKVSSGQSDDVKMVVMNKKQMLVGIDHYNDMRKKCKAKEVGEDEVIMKKNEVEQKDQRIKELEKCAGITDDEVMVNKEELEYMKSRIADFEKVSSGESDGKMVVMKDDSMMIKIEHYKDIRNRCIELEKQMKELSGEQGVLVQEKNLKTIEAEIEHVKKNIALIAEGRNVDESVIDHTNTPQKRRLSQGDQPPSKRMARMVAKKNLEMEKEMPEEIEGYEKGDTYCKICKSEENTHF